MMLPIEDTQRHAPLFLSSTHPRLALVTRQHQANICLLHCLSPRSQCSGLPPEPSSASCRALGELPQAEAELLSGAVRRLLDGGVASKAASQPANLNASSPEGSLPGTWLAAAAAPGPPLPLLPDDAAALLQPLVKS